MLYVAALAQALVPVFALAAHRYHSRSSEVHEVARQRSIPYPKLALPLQINGSQYFPLAWADIPGWNDDDQLAAYRTFRASCRPIAAQHDLPSGPKADPKALGISLRDPCRAARATEISDGAKARGFFEVYTVPVYRRPSNLFVRGFKQDAPSLPNKGEVFRKIGRRKLVPYYDRAQIEDGAIAGRGLEICWLKNPTDLLFAQIQGSARIRLQDGSTVRINYDAHNGYPYTAVGRVLIDRGIIPKEEMSMQRIREWMEQNPDGAKDLRRQNRSYIFFREVNLSDKDEAVGAQGVPLTPGRSIAVDKSLHVYGTPFFIEGQLPIESEQSKTPFHRLMIAQDTGSAITGPARADLYFGAGADAGKVSGRLRHSMHFVMLVPKSLDPIERGRKMPIPDPRPSEKIAKLFPPPDGAKTASKNQTGTASAPGSSMAQASATAAAAAVPLPEARPKIPPAHEPRHQRRRYRRSR